MSLTATSQWSCYNIQIAHINHQKHVLLVNCCQFCARCVYIVLGWLHVEVCVKWKWSANACLPDTQYDNILWGGQWISITP